MPASDPPSEPRPPAQRKAEILTLLATPVLDGWVASAGSGSGAHLVPLALHWTGDHLAVALELTSLTARNIAASGRARVALGGTRNVVMIDVTHVSTIPVADAPEELADGYATQSDWDPRDSPDGYVYMVLRPERVQAWRELNEFPGRTLMRDGIWLV